MYEPHKDNLERVKNANRRVAAIEQRCQAAIREILEAEGLVARIVFYPKSPDWDTIRGQVTEQFKETLAYLHKTECTCSPLTKYTDSPHEPGCGFVNRP